MSSTLRKIVAGATLALLGLGSSAVSTVSAQSCNSGLIALDSDFSYCYRYTPSSLYIEASVAPEETGGWLAFGFTTSGMMSGASVMLGYDSTISNYNLGNHVASGPGQTKLAVTSASSSVDGSSGLLTIKFSLPLTGGSYTVSNQAYINAGAATLIFARGPQVTDANNIPKHTYTGSTDMVTFQEYADPSSTGAEVVVDSSSADVPAVESSSSGADAVVASSSTAADAAASSSAAAVASSSAAAASSSAAAASSSAAVAVASSSSSSTGSSTPSGPACTSSQIHLTADDSAGDFQVCYAYSRTALYIEASAVPYQAGGWLGFGFSHSGMAGSTVMIGYNNTISNYNLESSAAGPSGQTTMNVSSSSVSLVSGRTVLKFVLPLSNGAFSNFLTTSGTARLVYARGPAPTNGPDDLPQHAIVGSTNSITFALPATSSTGSDGSSGSNAAGSTGHLGAASSVAVSGLVLAASILAALVANMMQ